MKKLLAILLLFTTVLPAVGQTDKHSPTQSYLQTKDPSYTPKIPKNEFSCDFELLLSASITYKRKITSKISLGATFNLLGVAGGIPWFNGEDLGAEAPKMGVLFSYRLNTKWSFELIPQYIIFLNSFDDFNTETHSSYGLENGIFYKWKKIEIGLSVYFGRIQDNYPKYMWKWTAYNSLIILRVPLKKW